MAGINFPALLKTYENINSVTRLSSTNSKGTL